MKQDAAWFWQSADKIGSVAVSLGSECCVLALIGSESDAAEEFCLVKELNRPAKKRSVPAMSSGAERWSGEAEFRSVCALSGAELLDRVSAQI